MRKHFLELIRKTSSELPDDVVGAIQYWSKLEKRNSPARMALEDMLANSSLARETSRPICQDTGTNIWHVYHPQSVSTLFLRKEIEAATKKATKLAYLRPNAVDPITGVNSGNNIGEGAPLIYFHEWTRKTIVADLLFKGGGSENVSAQYLLPNIKLGAGRDVEGVRKTVIEVVFKAQGKGCGPGIVGVGIGGDLSTCINEAKKQLFRMLDDKNPDPVLHKLEKRLYKDCNSLKIGPMGFGGEATVLGVKIGKRHRVPASFFVSIAYLCVAARRASLSMSSTGERASYSQISQFARQYILSDSKEYFDDIVPVKGG